MSGSSQDYTRPYKTREEVFEEFREEHEEGTMMEDVLEALEPREKTSAEIAGELDAEQGSASAAL